jgi:hypothetical protein
LLLIIIGAVVGGIIGSRAANKSNNANKNGSNLAVAGGTTVSRDTNGNPVYPSSVRMLRRSRPKKDSSVLTWHSRKASSAPATAPTVVTSNANLACTGDTWTPGANANGSPYPLRPDHPRLLCVVPASARLSP